MITVDMNVTRYEKKLAVSGDVNSKAGLAMLIERRLIGFNIIGGLQDPYSIWTRRS
jgi:hypothetical protein